MIASFGSQATEDFYHGRTSKEARRIPQDIKKVALRKLDMIHSAYQLRDLMRPSANRLELLKGKYRGMYSIRVNRQYRIIFVFEAGNAYEVEIIDYH